VRFSIDIKPCKVELSFTANYNYRYINTQNCSFDFELTEYSGGIRANTNVRFIFYADEYFEYEYWFVLPNNQKHMFFNFSLYKAKYNCLTYQIYD
jgi:hypothetical protein